MVSGSIGCLPRGRAVLVLIVVGAIVLSLYSLLWEPNDLKVRRIVLYFPTLPDQADGWTIGVISDLHMRRIGPRERKVVDVLNTDPPRFLSILGDFVSRSRHRDACLSFLRMLPKDVPKYAIQGNWEHYVNWVGEKLREDLSGVDIRLLDNEAVQLLQNFWLVGVDDPSLDLDDQRTAMSQAGDGFVVMLAHSPEIANRLSPGVDLVLSGHTHGGQVVLPLIGAPWGEAIGGGYRYGLFELKAAKLYVTSGVGMTHLPVRFLCPPEVVYVKLRKGDGPRGQ